MKKIGFIGAGNMAGAIIGGIVKSGLVKPENVIASAKTMTNLEKLKDEYKINVTLDTREVVKNSDIVFMAVKPNIFDDVLTDVKDLIGNEKIVVSIAAGKNIAGIEKIIGNDKVKELELIKTELIQKDSETRLVPVNIENSNYKISMDYVVMALGSEPATVVQKLGLKLDKWGNIKIDENYKTSDSKIYACGDLAGIRKTVAWAAYSGREAANKIIEKIK